MKKYRASALIERVHDIIEEYGRNRMTLTDLQISEMRAALAVGVYMIVENILEPQYMRVLQATMAAERAEGESFKRQMAVAASEGYTKSQAIDIARKYSKMDDQYLSTMEEMLAEKNYLNLVNTLISQANQIINAMSSRKPTANP